MDMLSVTGATAWLECAVLLMGLVLLLDMKRMARRRAQLLRHMQSTLAEAETALPEVSHPKAA